MRGTGDRQSNRWDHRNTFRSRDSLIYTAVFLSTYHHHITWNVTFKCKSKWHISCLWIVSVQSFRKEKGGTAYAFSIGSTRHVSGQKPQRFEESTCVSPSCAYLFECLPYGNITREQGKLKKQACGYCVMFPLLTSWHRLSCKRDNVFQKTSWLSKS